MRRSCVHHRGILQDNERILGKIEIQAPGEDQNHQDTIWRDLIWNASGWSLFVFPLAMEDENIDEDSQRRDAIQSRIEQVLGDRCVVRYGAYEFDEGGLPIDNLDEIAVEGTVRFVHDYSPDRGDGRAYESAPVQNPTCPEVTMLANDMILTTGDRTHCWFEGFHTRRKGKVIKTLELDMGS